MKLVIQRVKNAKVEVGGKTIGQIGAGILVLLGVAENDTSETADILIEKLTNLRIFEDDRGKMNLSSYDVSAQYLIVSQFTLYGDCSKGRRPSFDKAGKPAEARVLYQYFIDKLKSLNFEVQTGEFGAMMDVHLINEGPVTFILES